MDKLIYLDNAATTKTSPEVVEAMLCLILQNIMGIRPVYIRLRRQIRK